MLLHDLVYAAPFYVQSDERLKLRRVGSKLSAVESTEEYSVELHSDLEDAAPASGVAQEALTSMTVPNEFNFPGVTICEALSATGILFQLKERSYGGGTISWLFGSMYVYP